MHKIVEVHNDKVVLEDENNNRSTYLMLSFEKKPIVGDYVEVFEDDDGNVYIDKMDQPPAPLELDIIDNKPNKPSRMKQYLTIALSTLVIGVLIGVFSYQQFFHNRVTMPNLIGMNQEYIETSLAEQGISESHGHNIIFTNQTNNSTIGQVHNQSPEPGTPITRNTNLRIYISQGIKIPELMNINPDYNIETNVKHAISNAGLNPVIEHVVVDNDRLNTILSIAPDVGTFVNPGSNVIVQIGVQNQKVRMPDLIGLTQYEAESLLDEKDFNINIRHEYTETYIGQVMEQSILANTEVEPDSNLTLVIGQQATSTMINVRGLTYGTALAKLHDLGFSVTTTNCRENYYVFDQNRRAGQTFARGIEVRVSCHIPQQ